MDAGWREENAPEQKPAVSEPDLTVARSRLRFAPRVVTS
jgi:hypothetical protein